MLYKFVPITWKKLQNYSTNIQIPKNLKGKWKSVVGLEVHAQLSSGTKLFTTSPTDYCLPINSAISNFDVSIPGTLPVLNRKCVEYGIKTALALDCCINSISMFDRKHYFYADLPNGYQITQQRKPLANNGKILFPVIVPGKKVYEKTVRLLQLQLEQDSGKSLHDEESKRSLIDLNRAGLPLMELVFAPDLETGEEAASLVKELTLILRNLQTCSCKMEEGALRVDANVSVHEANQPLGVRTEIKNISSIRSISQAVTYEIQRQFDSIAKGIEIINETRSWNAEKRCTIAMRDKEILQDYRFIPEPNLPPLHVNTSKVKQTKDIINVIDIAKQLPQLPKQTRQNLINKYELNQELAIILVNEFILLDYFQHIVKTLPNMPSKSIANFLINDFLTFCNKQNIDVNQCNVTYDHIKDILKALHAEEINLLAARQLINLSHENNEIPVNELISLYNLEQISDLKTIENYCHLAIKKELKAVKEYKKGKTKALYAIAGEVAKISNDKANMKMAIKCLENLLK